MGDIDKVQQALEKAARRAARSAAMDTVPDELRADLPEVDEDELSRTETALCHNILICLSMIQLDSEKLQTVLNRPLGPSADPF